MFTFGLNPLLTKYSKFVVYASNSAPSPAPLLVWLGQQLFCIDTLQRNIHFRQGTCMRNHWCSHYRWHWSLCWQMLWSTIRWQWIHPQSRCLYWAVGGWVSYHACLDVWGQQSNIKKNAPSWHKNSSPMLDTEEHTQNTPTSCAPRHRTNTYTIPHPTRGSINYFCL